MTGALANKIFTQNNFLEILIFLNFLYFPDLNKILWTQKKKKKKQQKKKKPDETPENLISIKSKNWWSWQKPTIF